jgi:predicted phage terminase large subunit-like protein
MSIATKNKDINKERLLLSAMENPLAVSRALNDRSLFHFIEYFWDEVSAHTFSPNWHIEYLSSELEKIAERVGQRQAREYDMIINVPPGTTKTITCSIMFPVWCWTRWHWMRFICASYSNTLSLESAEYCRDLIRSTRFRQMYPELDIRDDKDTKSNFKIVKKVGATPGRAPKILFGGSRYSTSVGGTLTGFHGDILIVDDPLNPNQAASELELGSANRWCEQTLSTRKTDKAVTPTIYIMQRLHQDDPAGHILTKRKENVRHICLPGDARRFKEKINPPELYKFYRDDLLDPIRLPWKVLADMEADLGQYSYAGQIGQDPTPPGGGMFKVANFEIIDELPPAHLVLRAVRYWDKAGSKEQGSAFTVGCKMLQLINGRWIIEDVRRGRWTAERREAVIQETAKMDGPSTVVWLEQEPGSGGKESAQASILGLAGYIVYAERPTGDKASRADSYSVQVNNGGVRLLKAPWNRDFIEEHRFFPFSTYKDQVDAASGAFNKLVFKKLVRRIT